MSGVKKKIKIENYDRHTMKFFMLFLIASLIHISCGQAVELKTKNPSHLKHHSENVYVVDLKEVGSGDLVLYCSSSYAIDLNFTYNGLSESFSTRVISSKLIESFKLIRNVLI